MASFLDSFGSAMAQNPRLWIGNLLASLAGYDPQTEQKKNALGVLNQLVSDQLGYNDLALEGNQYVNQNQEPVYTLTPEQEMLALGSDWLTADPLLKAEREMQLTPEQTNALIGNDWQPTRAAPLTEDQEYARRIARYTSALAQQDPLAALEYATEAYDPIGRKDRVSNRAYKDAQTEYTDANTQNLLAGLEDDYDLGWFMDPSRTQEERDRYVRGKHGPSRESSYIQLLKRRDKAIEAGDQEEVERINGLLSRIDKIPGPGGTTLIYDRGSGQVEPVTAQPEMIAGTEALAAAAASGKDIGTKEAQLPTLETNFQHHLDSLDRLLEHPGFEGGVGLGAWNPLRLVPGTTENDFRLALENVKGQLYSMAYETLKGAGHITEFEASTVARGLAALDASLSEEEFKKNAANLKDLMGNLREAVRRRASGEETLPTPRRRFYNPDTGEFEDR